MKTNAALPAIKNDLYNALIKTVSFGPRRECILTAHRVIWEGDRGHYEKTPWYIRFGGVENMRELQKFFRRKPHKQSELYTIDYAEGEDSKPGRLFLSISFERIDAQIVVRCQNVPSSSTQPNNEQENEAIV